MCVLSCNLLNHIIPYDLIKKVQHYKYNVANLGPSPKESITKLKTSAYLVDYSFK